MKRLKIAALVLSFAWPAAAAPNAWSPRSPPPRDLAGIWTTASWTQLQRSKDASGLVITEAQGQALHAAGVARQRTGDTIGQATSEFAELGDGYARIRGQLRSSWLVDPADGRLPYTEATRKAVQAYGDADGPTDYDNVESRPTGERCLTAEGAGAPILNSPDTNLLTLVQTKDALVIVSEKNHDARIVQIRARASRPPSRSIEPTSWMGTSVGHWDGATLVVETTHLRPGVTYLSDAVPLSDKARVTERFTRNGPNEIGYDFVVDDPDLYSRPWRGEMVFRTAAGRMFEFACHEGNYSLAGILTGGMKEKAKKPPAKTGG
jgi:hypothetical protein